MFTLKKMIVLATLVLSTTSHAAINKSGNMKSQKQSRVSAMNTEVKKLQVPTIKNPDPALALGLGHNPADCAFKSQIAKNGDSNGARFGQNSPLNTVGSSVGSRHNQ